LTDGARNLDVDAAEPGRGMAEGGAAGFAAVDADAEGVGAGAGEGAGESDGDPEPEPEPAVEADADVEGAESETSAVPAFIGLTRRAPGPAARLTGAFVEAGVFFTLCDTSRPRALPALGDGRDRTAAGFLTD